MSKISPQLAASFAKWAQQVLPQSQLQPLEKECTELQQVLLFDSDIVPNRFPVHKTLASLVAGVTVSEAEVERAFSRHKLVHSKMRASLNAETLNDQLFIRYNLDAMLQGARQFEAVPLFDSDAPTYEPLPLSENTDGEDGDEDVETD